MPDIIIKNNTVELNVIKEFETQEEMLEAVEELGSLRDMMAKPESPETE